MSARVMPAPVWCEVWKRRRSELSRPMALTGALSGAPVGGAWASSRVAEPVACLSPSPKARPQRCVHEAGCRH